VKLAFSTLSCPDWDLETILKKAVEYGYQGIEFRGYQDTLYLPRAEPFLPDRIPHTRKMCTRYGLEIVCVSSSAYLAAMDPEEREKNLREVRDYIQLAYQLGAPFVRVFGGDLKREGRPTGSVPALIENLKKAGEEAAAYGVTVLLETHDAFISGQAVAQVLSEVCHPHVGALWDLHHPYRFAGESPATTVRYLKAPAGPSALGRGQALLRHVHLKDSRGKADHYVYTPLGEGDIPILEMLQVLWNNGYRGYLTLEWEKRWHPELEDPERILPQYADKLREYLIQVQREKG